MPSRCAAVILQARLDSTRLPQKALLDLGGEPLIVRVMQALKNVRADMHVIACPHDATAMFAPLAAQCGFEIFAGDKNNVLDRYCSCIVHFDLDRKKDSHVIRATGDNPFVFADAASAICGEAEDLGADYAAYAGLPYGAGVEAVSIQALLRAWKDAGSDYEREHVCPHLYAHPEKFRLHRPLAPLKWQRPDLRLTVDEQADYEHAQILYAALDKNVMGKNADGKNVLGKKILGKKTDACARYEGQTMLKAFDTLA
jgi:spore coat polysaccharide biosynthesis protein SpsF